MDINTPAELLCTNGHCIRLQPFVFSSLMFLTMNLSDMVIMNENNIYVLYLCLFFFFLTLCPFCTCVAFHSAASVSH